MRSCGCELRNMNCGQYFAQKRNCFQSSIFFKKIQLMKKTAKHVLIQGDLCPNYCQSLKWGQNHNFKDNQNH